MKWTKGFSGATIVAALLAISTATAFAETAVDTPIGRGGASEGSADAALADSVDLAALALDAAAQSRQSQCPNGWICNWDGTKYSGSAIFLQGNSRTYSEFHMQEAGWNDRVSSIYNRWTGGNVVIAQNDRAYDYNNYYGGKFMCLSYTYTDPDLSTTSGGNWSNIISMEKFNRDGSCYR